MDPGGTIACKVGFGLRSGNLCSFILKTPIAKGGKVVVTIGGLNVCHPD